MIRWSVIRTSSPRRPASATSAWLVAPQSTVTTSSAAAAGNVSPDVRVDAQYLVDVVSSASVDVVTAATARVHDTRHEATVGVTAYNLRGSYIYPTENDWDSHTFSLGATHDLLRHNLTIGASLVYATNRIARDGFPAFYERLRSGGGEVFAAYTLSPRDLVTYAGELGLDAERFRDDLHAHTGADHVADDIDGADLSDVSGTPTFFINGHRHLGAYDIDTLAAAVKQAGAQAKLLA